VVFNIEHTLGARRFYFSLGRGAMQDKTERWKELCAQAAVEQDPQRLLELTREINDLLLGKQRRLERPDDEAQK
jgi:hypothetical protein